MSIDLMTGETQYGDEYTIACTWTAEAAQERDDRGAEFVSRHQVFTEDDRPKYLDMIRLGDSGEWEQIRSVTGWDMAMFSDTPDFKLVT